MKHLSQKQTIPLVLTILTFFGLTGLLYMFIYFLNLLPLANKISPRLYSVDILVGLIIYIKTSIDFALFIGSLMHTYPGMKNRIAIEVGTALGNGFGTFLVLAIWTFFKEVPLLLVTMVILASLVLLQMAENGFTEYFEKPTLTKRANTVFLSIASFLQKINSLFRPVLLVILPQASLRDKGSKNFWSLVLFAFSIPFILGLDDFAGYIPLFSVINVFGFATGVFLGHMILNISLFASPALTTKIVRLPIILAIGSLVFIGLALWGFYEAFHTLFPLILH